MKHKIGFTILFFVLISGTFVSGTFAQESQKRVDADTRLSAPAQRTSSLEGHSRDDFRIEKAVYDSVQKWIQQGLSNPADETLQSTNRWRFVFEDSIRTVLQNIFLSGESRDSNGPTPYISAISGRVFESDGSTPVSGTPVRIYNTSWQQAGWDETDGNGNFLVGNLQAGNYYLYAEGYVYTKGNVYFPEYFDGAESQGSATQISVADSDTTENIQITLNRKAAISGRVCQSDGTTPITNTMVDIYNSAWEPVTGAFTNGEGYYTVYGLLGGTYFLKATGYIVGEGEFYIEEYYDDSATKGGASSVSVEPPNTVNGINFNLTRGYHVWLNVVEGVGYVTINPQKLVYAPGDVVELYAYPCELYPQFIFDHWGGDIDGTMNPKSVSCEGADYEIQADVYFREMTGPQYYLNVSANPDEAGSITREPDQTKYDSAAVVQIRAVPEEGWTFREWSTDLSGNENPATIVMNSDKYISGQFGHSLDITVYPEGAGTVTRSPDKDVYDHQEGVQITAVPQDGYHFERWDGDYEGVDNPAYLTMSSNKGLYAVFQQIQTVTLTMQVYPEGTGETVPAVGSHTYELNAVVEIAAEPVDGYRFKYWEGGCIAQPCSAHTAVTMNESRTVKAKFEAIPSGNVTLTMQVYPEGSGVTVPAVGNHTYELNAVVEIAAEPVDGYRFKYWEGGCIADIYCAHTTVVMNESRTVKAKFEEIVSSEVTLTMQVNPEGIGQTYPEIGTHTYEKNDVVQVIAYAPQGYFFAYWEGGTVADSTAQETTVILDEDRVLTAHFSVSDSSPPVLKNCYPGPGSQCVPHNTKIQFSIKDKDSGTDLHHLNVWVNGIVIIENGEDQTGGYTLITAQYEAKRIKYFPPDPFEAGSAVTVRVQIPDLAVPPNLCDSTYFFTTSSANIDTSDATSIGQQGGTVSDPVTGIEMEIPAEALQDTVEITITQVDDIPPLPDGLQGLAAPAHFGPDGLQFQIPISVRIPYTQADLDSAGIESPEMLRIYYYHTSTGEWMELTIAHVDTENRIVTVTVQKFCYLTFGQSDATDAEDPVGQNIHADNFLLSQNYPNPFNPETQITYEIAKPCRVSLSVFDTNGRLIKSLVQGERIPGKYILMWDATSTAGNKVPSGLYLLVMKAGDYHAVQKMSLLK